jgi:hypothetical protein
MINRIGFKPAVMASIVIALQAPQALRVDSKLCCIASLLNASPESQGDEVHRKHQRIYVLYI